MFHVRTLGNASALAGRGGGDVSIRLYYMDAAELAFGFKKADRNLAAGWDCGQRRKLELHLNT
jgi:hypothetical protein